MRLVRYRFLFVLVVRGVVRGYLIHWVLRQKMTIPQGKKLKKAFLSELSGKSWCSTNKLIN